MNKLKNYLIAFLVLGSIGFGLYERFRSSKIEDRLSGIIFERDSLVQLDSITVAIRARDVLEKDSLADALRTANDLNGQLIAAANIHIRPRPVHDTIFIAGPDTSSGDILTYTFSDTTNEGVLDGVATLIPPPPYSFGMEYRFSSAPLDITASLIGLKDGKSIIAVTYRGGSATITSPYSIPIEKKKRFSTQSSVLYDPTASSIVLRQTGLYRLPLVKNVFFTIQGEQKFHPGQSSVYFGFSF